MTSNAQTTAETPKSSSSTESTSLSSEQTDSSTTPRKRRENKQDKALRYLKEARLTVVMVEGDVVRAECRGNSGRIYQLGFHDNRWSCDCLARTDCCHLIALQLVTVRPR